MNKFFALITVTFLFGFSYSQTIVKTYYNFNKSMPHEIYYVNSKGEKHGTYKAFSKENGVIMEEVNFYNGELMGQHKVYNWHTGKAVLFQIETYKGNIKNGEAKYYFEDFPNIIRAQGNYLNGVKHGVWTYIEKLDGEITKGHEFYKTSETFDNGKRTKTANKIYYYPAGSLYCEFIFNNDNSFQKKYFYPNGKLASEEFYDENENIVKELNYYLDGYKSEHFHSIENDKKIVRNKSFFPDNKLKESNVVVDGVEVEYEGYNEDGSKNEKMRDKEEKKGIEEKKKQEQTDSYFNALNYKLDLLKKEIKNRDNLVLSSNFEGVLRKSDTVSIIGYEIVKMKNKLSNNSEFQNKIKTAEGLINENNNLITKVKFKIDSLNVLKQDYLQQNNTIEKKYNLFLANYSNYSESIRASRPLNGEMPHEHKNGEHLFQKGNLVITQILNERSTESSIKAKVEKGNEIINLLNKLNQLAGTDTKKINKQLKTIENKVEIYSILEINN